jgi:hypothetical protein
VSRVAIIAAMAGELKPLVRGWVHERRDRVDLWRWKFDEGEWVAACAGAGVDAATRAFAAVEKDGAPDMVISVGWAGALTEELKAGRVYGVSGVIDLRTGERFRPAVWNDERWLVTSPIVADEAEKQRLAAAYKCSPGGYGGFGDCTAGGDARDSVLLHQGGQRRVSRQATGFQSVYRPDGRFDLTGMVLFSILRPWYWPSLADGRE